MKIELAKCKKCGGESIVHRVAFLSNAFFGEDNGVEFFARCASCGEMTQGNYSSIEDAVKEWNEFNKEEPMTFENGKIYHVKSPETGTIYPAFWSSDRERFIVLQLVAGGEVNTFELEKGCVVEDEE